jgi:hypothetical protein
MVLKVLKSGGRMTLDGGTPDKIPFRLERAARAIQQVA